MNSPLDPYSSSLVTCPSSLHCPLPIANCRPPSLSPRPILKRVAVFILILQSLLPGVNAKVFAESTATRSAYNPISGPDYPLDEDSYFTDDNGNILMDINVLGEVNKQGPIVVKEKVDFAKILALVGGVKSEADLNQVMVVRQEPEKNGKTVYIINLKKYYNQGDRTAFIALKPNDTIIFPEKGFSLAKIASVFGFVFSTATGIYYIRQL